ncbi:pentatricopeptide repeat-containing protein At3g42630 isoform X2 [Phoenix dactylifera]|uniref:Pentatricopeptide repeat-containing protein At3g42630 isoform X2 n=1 Tax=Phoenix dactylifera TaxID=42345 RepID=A0A8B8IZ52_PHODC|nr:pentatricopeptide repeat-containing protein At3g42630 isoform X2 [Phoenix dactylifera]
MTTVVAAPSSSSPSLSFSHSTSSSRRSTFACCQRPPRSRKQSLRSGASPRGNSDEMVQNWRKKEKRTDDEGVAALIQALNQDKMPEVALKLLIDLKSKGFVPGCATLSALVLCYANNGLFQQAKALWSEIINSSFLPSIEVVSGLMDAYAMMGQFDEISTIVHEIASRQDFGFSCEVYSLAVSCFGKVGQLELMEDMVKEMVLRGFKVDSMTGNAFVKYYSLFGSIEEMEAAYGRMKKSRILIEKEAIRAMASAYISGRKFYKLGEFLRDVGLGRRNVGNLLWNLLLLSYAANFKMKSLQREFISMVGAGFSPDLTTFNIRSLAYSRMCMFWDLHLSIEHMKHEGVIPDLVTYGCLVDAYLERRLGRNLSFALEKMNAESAPVMLTDPLVFEAIGKGDFQSSSETLLESTRQRGWTYSKLVSIYLRKQYRSNQIFWNY